ncbi:hypothetical protein BKA69DRAFT_258308 [Paraphysoderma sedebokerense]|nr:hypothetical protein BKA69DRAFT_258308 [Paraphysoderma sedebokerense]
MICQYVVITIYDLIANDDVRKTELVEEGVLPILHRYISHQNSSTKEITFWALVLVHSLTSQDELHASILEYEFISPLGQMIRSSYGNASMQKLCVHALVRLIGGSDTDAIEKHLKSLLPFNIVALLTSMIKSDDTELAYWCLCLMHEFVSKDVCRAEFRQRKDIIKSLISLLSIKEDLLVRVVLRSLKFLSLRDEPFQKQLIKNGLVAKLMGLLADSNDEDNKYWALTVLHDLSSHASACREIVTRKNITVLNELASSSKPVIPLYIVDIYSSICGLARCNDAILDSNVIEGVLKFLRSDDYDLQCGGLTCLFNLTVMGDAIIEELEDYDVIDILKDLILNHQKQKILSMTAKIIAVFASKNPYTKNYIRTHIVKPLLAVISSLISNVVHAIYLQSNIPFADKLSPQVTHSPRQLLSPVVNNFGSISLPQGSELNNSVAPEIVLESGFLQVEPSEEAWISEENIQRINSMTQESASLTINTSARHLSSDPAPTPVNLATGTQSLQSQPSSSIPPSISPDLAGKLLSSYSERLLGLLNCIDVWGTEARLFDEIEDRLANVIQTEDNEAGPKADGERVLALSDTVSPPSKCDSSQPFIATTNDIHPGDISPSEETSPTDSVGLVDVANSLLDLVLLPLLNQSFKLKQMDRHEFSQDDSEVSGSTKPDWRVKKDLTPSAESGGHLNDQDENVIRSTKTNLARLGIVAIATLAEIRESVRLYLVEERYLGMLIAIIQETLKDSYIVPAPTSDGDWRDLRQISLEAFSRCACLMPRSVVINVPHAVTTIWDEIYRLSCPQTSKHGLMVLGNDRAAHELFYCHYWFHKFVVFPPMAKSTYIRIGEEGTSPNVAISDNGLEVRNDKWTFESVRATHGVRSSGKYMYEVVLSTDGLIQIGWANTRFMFDPEGGNGVGDDFQSYSYDGYRQRKWHGAMRDEAVRIEQEYGEQWFKGDVIGVMIDFDSKPGGGLIQFMRNGKDMGVAFDTVDKQETWFPALSLSTSQGCRLAFGGMLDPLRFQAPGFKSLAAAFNLPIPVSSGSPPKPTLPTNEQTSNEHTLDEPASDDHTPNELASDKNRDIISLQIPFQPDMYFEVMLGLHGWVKSITVLQVGVTDRLHNTIFLAFYKSKAIVLNVQCDTEDEDCYITYLPEFLDRYYSKSANGTEKSDTEIRVSRTVTEVDITPESQNQNSTENSNLEEFIATIPGSLTDFGSIEEGTIGSMYASHDTLEKTSADNIADNVGMDENNRSGKVSSPSETPYSTQPSSLLNASSEKLPTEDNNDDVFPIQVLYEFRSSILNVEQLREGDVIGVAVGYDKNDGSSKKAGGENDESSRIVFTLNGTVIGILYFPFPVCIIYEETIS